MPRKSIIRRECESLGQLSRAEWLAIIQAALIGLKLLGLIGWPWLYVFGPTIAAGLVVAGVVAGCVGMYWWLTRGL